MSTSFTSLRRLCSALSLSLVVAACSEEITKPAARSFTPPTASSRVATPTDGRHVFVLNGKIPADFVSRVAAKGGTVVRVVPEINMGQLRLYLSGTYGIPVTGFNRVKGKPLRVSEMVTAFTELLKES